jgi:putative DNA primase/helicase
VHWHQAADPDGAADLALSLAAGANVYFGVGLHPEPLSGNRRGTADRVVTLPGLWADVDIAHDVHKKAKHLPPTVEAAQELVMSMGPKPSIVVHTGHGLQAYWLFDGPVTFTSPEHRDEFKNLSERWGETLKSRAAERRWKVDSTFDISRVLRVPYTVNRKAEPVPVRIMEVR